MRVKGPAVLRRTPAALGRLQSKADALAVVRGVLDADPHTTTLALVDRRPPHDGLVACCSEPLTHADLDQLDECILEAALLAEAGCRMVLASWRPDAPDVVDEADLDLWRRLQARHAATPVPLLDWLVVGAGYARSLAEVAGPRPRWRTHR